VLNCGEARCENRCTRDAFVTDDMLVFNGVDAETGDYLTPPTSVASLASEVREEQFTGSHVRELRRRHQDDEAHLGVVVGRDPDDLASAAWGLVVPEDIDLAVVEALEPLIQMRQEQAGDLFKRLVVKPNEEKEEFLRRYGMGPSPADPRKVPYYLLIVAGPHDIPFSFQYQLDVSYAVGRLNFDQVEAYAAYANAVVAAEQAVPSPPERLVHLFGTRNPGDTPTALSASRLVQPLGKDLRELASGWRVTEDVGEPATRSRLEHLLQGNLAPQVLFTASHGVGTSTDNQREIQGALLCQEWPGPLVHKGHISEDFYLAGQHVSSDRPVRPRVVFSFACYGAGTPSDMDFTDAAGAPGSRLTTNSFVARLPQRLLGNPAGGALAFIGHVDRAWSCSFLWKGLDAQVTSFMSTMLAMLNGVRVGHAMESLNSRYAEIATELTQWIARYQKYRMLSDEAEFVGLWTANNDARNYLLLGDPAVRAAPPGAAGFPNR
jgi:Peptidase family C25